MIKEDREIPLPHNKIHYKNTMNNETQIKSLRMPIELVKAIDEMADKEMRNFTQQTIYLLQQQLKNNE